MSAHSENEETFQCIKTCPYPSTALNNKDYRFCPINPPSTTTLSTTSLITFSIKFPTFTSSEKSYEVSSYIYFTILFVLFSLLLIIFFLILVFYYIKKKEKNSKTIVDEKLALTAYIGRELKTVSMSSLDWDKRQLLGRGKFGSVYKCYCVHFNENVAVKELSSKEEMSHTTILKEIEIMSQLRHPNLTQILGYNYTTNLKILTPLRRYDLARYLLRLDTVEIGDIIRFCFEITDAMAYLHSRKIVHCDLKASNILVKDEFSVEVADFGLATIMGDSNKINGTSTHMPLEYLTGSVKKPTKEGDIWSFGVTAWEIFTYCKEKPYGEFFIDSLSKMIQFLTNGTRLSKPPLLYEQTSLWSVILSCTFTLKVF